MVSKSLIRLKHWLHEADKLQHIIASIVLVQVGAYWLELWVAVALAFMVGVVKEVGDKLFRAGFSWGDIAANATGVALGMVLVMPLL